MVVMFFPISRRERFDTSWSTFTGCIFCLMSPHAAALSMRCPPTAHVSFYGGVTAARPTG
jgi:hypothetical protein